jgi:hypothetical protein
VVWWDKGEGEKMDKDGGKSMRVDEKKEPHRETPERRRPRKDDPPLNIAQVLEVLGAR